MKSDRMLYINGFQIWMGSGVFNQTKWISRTNNYCEASLFSFCDDRDGRDLVSYWN